MSLRSKLLIFFTLAVAAAAGVTAWNADRYAAAQYQKADQQRSAALVAQFRGELSEREAEVTTSIQTIADAESTVRMVLDLSGPQGDPSIYSGDARGLAAARHLDFLELATTDGSLISSAQWPDHIGTKETWVTHENDWNQRGAFLDRVELPDRVDLGLIAVRMVHAGNLNLYIVGGQRLDAGFLRTLSLPEGMRALLYRNLQADFSAANVSDSAGAVDGAESFGPLIQSLQKQPVNANGLNGPDGPNADGAAPSVSWSADSNSAERFIAVPLTGKQGEFLGALLLGSPEGELVAFENNVGGAAVLVAAAGLVLAIFLSWWIAARVSNPLKRLTEGIGEVEAGDWDAQVEEGSVREVQQPIAAFNKMTKRLADERAGQVARERAAAWRQLAGQLAVELATLLPPLQSAVQGLARPVEQSGEDEGFAPDGSEQIAPVGAAMRQTLETLAACAGKLGEFAALPVPRLEAVNVNDTVRGAVQSFEPQFSAIGRPPISPELYLDERAGEVRADPVLLRKVFENLLLFVIEDMPAGGTFTIYTRRQEDMAHIILSHSGATPPRGESGGRALDRTARVSGIGLSLATVQSIVSSHGGKISIETAPLAGTTFYLDWPVVSATKPGAGAAPQPMAPVFSDAQQQPEPAVRRQREADQPNRPRMAPAESQSAQIREAQKQAARPVEESREIVHVKESVGELPEQLPAEKLGEARQPALEFEPGPEPAAEAEPGHGAAEIQLHEMEQVAAQQDEQGIQQQRPQEHREEQPPSPQHGEQYLQERHEEQAQQPLPAPASQAASYAEAETPAAAMASAAAPLEAPAEQDETPQEVEPEVVANTSETRSLAAVIEEMFETPSYAAKFAESFADGKGNQAGAVDGMGRGSELLSREHASETSESLIEVSVVSGHGSLGGMFAPEMRPETQNDTQDGMLSDDELDDVLAGWYADSVPQLFGVPVPPSMLDVLEHDKGQNEKGQEAQNEGTQGQNAQDAQLPVAEANPAVAPEAPAKSSEEQTEQKKQDSPRILTYSPLTYRW